MACKCKKAHECEECPEWIFTFADLVMLMMGFFVILWVLKPAPGKDSPKEEAEQQKWLSMIGDIRAGFGYVPDPTSHDPVDRAMIMRVPAGMHKAAENSDRPSAVGTHLNTTTIRDGNQSIVGGNMIFAAGSMDFSPATKVSLNQIADQIIGHRQIVQVKGFASLDDFPEGSPPKAFRDLALRRATAAADYLIERGVAPELIGINSRSTYEPVRQRTYGTDAQLENRRVEVQVTTSLLEERQGGTTSTAPAPGKLENFPHPE